jgi:hypothetical protein
MFRNPRALDPRLRPEAGSVVTLSRRGVLVLAFFLAALFAALSFWEMTGDSLTIDERVYLPTGYAYWTQRDFSLNREHPPFAKLWAALPLLVMDLKLPPVSPAENAAAYQMNLGSEFLFTQDVDRLLFWGRLPMLALGLLLAVFIFWWSWELHGEPGAALVSLFFVALEPTLIAHSHYVATDVPLACFSIMAMFFLWRFTQWGSLSDFVIASIGLGLALASKFSAVFLTPVFFGLLLLKWPVKRSGANDLSPALHSPKARSLGFFGAIVVAGLVVQASYLFSPDLSLYFKGLRAVNVYSIPQALLTYIHGDFFPGGVWWYQLYVLLLKLALPAIIVIAVAGGSLFSNREIPDRGLVFTLVPAAVYLVTTCAFANNLGVRYLSPVIAFFLVFAGRAWFVFGKNRKNKIIGSILALWLLVSVLRVSPHYISYFNELIGGPVNGPFYLDDSNIDWGQDFLRLVHYLRNQHVGAAVLGYWGPTPPQYYGKKYGIRFIPWTYEMAGSPTPPPGLYAISVNHLVGIKREKVLLNQAWDPNLDWLKRFQPGDRIGYSIYIYKFPQRESR